MVEKVLKSHNLSHFGVVSFQHLNIFEVRSKGRIPQNAKSVIAIIFPYYNKSANGGNVSTYCSVEDYHIVVMEQLKSIISDLEKLYPDNAFAPFVDSSPIDEVDMAVKAGLGVKGKNSLLITKEYGSFVFIGEIVTDLELPAGNEPYRHCISCNLCKKSCPGGAIGENGVDKSRCASFISQKKGELSEAERDILKRARTVFGCDICQNVCPHNKGISQKENLFSRNILNTVTGENAAEIYKDRPFGFRGLKVLERNLEIYNEKQDN